MIQINYLRTDLVRGKQRGWQKREIKLSKSLRKSKLSNILFKKGMARNSEKDAIKDTFFRCIMTLLSHLLVTLILFATDVERFPKQRRMSSSAA